MIRFAAFCLALLPVAAVAEPAAKIVSIGGSVTEIVVELGLQDHLIGRDSTSNYPPAILDLPDVGYIRALSPEGVLSLGPDLVISEAGAGPAEAVAVLRAAGVPFVEMPDEASAEGVLAKIDAVAKVLERPEEGAALRARVASGLEEARLRADALPAKKRVLFILNLQGGRVMAGGEGSSAEGIIELAGGINAATGFKGYKQMTDEAALAAAPDAIVMMRREGDLEVKDDALLSHPALMDTPAVKNGAIYRMDGLKLLGFGPRTPDAAQELFTLLYTGG